ncbi:MAG: ABC transporter ATP-binding protein [Treponema sp.]|jgi:iron complex transport system ATP-binding protein|nr:ABC transporter ATP-binding protein [Treponema sp.]
MDTLKLVPRLELEQLSIGFGKKPILSNLTLAVKPGELIALAGPNGSGKTTLLKTIGGLLKPLIGAVMLDGRDITLMGKREKALKISLLFQSATSDWGFTVEELVNQGRFPHHGFFRKGAAKNTEQTTVLDNSIVEKAIRSAGLVGFEHRVVTELSGGEFQRVLIARAMAQAAGLLLLDEPANNLDPKYQYMVMNLVRSMTTFGRVAIVSLHDLNLASLYADRVMLVGNGGLVAMGKPSEVLREDILEAVFGIPLVIAPHVHNPCIQAVFPPLPNLPERPV